MNENLDLTSILQGCPKGTEFYHSVFGKVFFTGIKLDSPYPITFIVPCDNYVSTGVTRAGIFLKEYEGECTLFPSKNQRDWSKFKRFWDNSKIEKFDVNTLQPSDKVLVRYAENRVWLPDFFGYKDGIDVMCVANGWVKGECIPYNEETKYLVGTTNDCPNYYKWWEE